IQYTYYASAVTGMDYLSLKPFFESEISDEQGHALYISEKIVTLGGEPTTQPNALKQVTDSQEMLEEAKKAESATIESYEARKEQAEALGMTELVNKLDDIIDDETAHVEKIERLLKDRHFK